MARKRMVTRSIPYVVLNVTRISKITKEVEEGHVKVVGVSDLDKAVAKITEGFKGTDSVLVSAELFESGVERYGMEESVFLNMAKNLDEESAESDEVLGGEA